MTAKTRRGRRRSPYRGSSVPVCKRCGRSIQWAITEWGHKRIPLDDAASPEGRYELNLDVAGAPIARVYKPQYRTYGAPPLYAHHSDTCRKRHAPTESEPAA